MAKTPQERIRKAYKRSAREVARLKAADEMRDDVMAMGAALMHDLARAGDDPDVFLGPLRGSGILFESKANERLTCGVASGVFSRSYAENIREGVTLLAKMVDSIDPRYDILNQTAEVCAMVVEFAAMVSPHAGVELARFAGEGDGK